MRSARRRGSGTRINRRTVDPCTAGTISAVKQRPVSRLPKWGHICFIDIKTHAKTRLIQWRPRCSARPWEVGQGNGQNKNSRRPAPRGRNPHQRCQERGPSPDDRKPPVGRNADTAQFAPAGRRQHAVAHPRQSRRRHGGRRQALRPRRHPGRHGSLHRAHDRRHHGALRTGLAHARQLLGARPPDRALPRSAGVHAGRLRHRHPAGRSAPERSRRPGRGDRAGGRLCGRARARRTDRRACRLRQGLGRRDPQRLDGGGAGARRNRAGERRPRAGGQGPRRLPDQDGREDRGRRAPGRSRSRASTGCTARPIPCCPTGSKPAPMPWRSP